MAQVDPILGKIEYGYFLEGKKRHCFLGLNQFIHVDHDSIKQS